MSKRLPKQARGSGTLEEALAGIPARVALTYARYKPGKPMPKSSRKVRLSIEEPPPAEVVVVLQFSEPGFGFGEVCLKQTPEGVFLDTECMSLDRVKRYFGQLLDSAITDIDQDPKRHKLYNRAKRRSCGPGCSVCHPRRKRRRA